MRKLSQLQVITSAGEPPGSDDTPEPLPDWEAMAQPEPEYLRNQQVQW